MSQQTLINLIESIADNKYVLGDRLVEVGFSAPTVESSLASVALAQGELGHARLLYNWVFDLNGVTGKKPDITKETGKSFPEVRAIDGWVKLIASFFAVNAASDIVMESMMNTKNSDITSNINKLYLEHKEHFIYSEGWAIKLLNDKGAVPSKFVEELNKIVPETEEWLKDVESSNELFEGGILSENNLVAKLQTIVENLKSRGAVVNVG
jgi:ring-1,2-phenylacetyl-CoA epoxidase subunit PaaC